MKEIDLLNIVFWVPAVSIIGVIFYLICIPRRNARTLAKKYNAKIQLLNSVVSVCTIISIFVGIWFLSYDQKIKRQIETDNKKIVIENLEEETDINLDLIREISEWEKHPGVVVAGRFQFYYLDKIKDVTVPKEIRRLAIDITNDLQQGNLFLEKIMGHEVRLLEPQDLKNMQEVTKANYQNMIKLLTPTKPKLTSLKDELKNRIE